jgi:imidazolonepropionase-like amidohydrolase
MTLQEIITKLDLKLLTDKKNFNDMEPTSGYASDLLSCVMAGAKSKGLWVTLQAHGNIVAIAALLELSAIIITEGAMPDLATIEKAVEEKVTLLSTPMSNFEVTGKLWELGLRANE